MVGMGVQSNAVLGAEVSNFFFDGRDLCVSSESVGQMGWQEFP
jgi:hypothetical protein